MARTAQAYLNVFRSWLGFSEANGKFRAIIDLYNSHTPRARGYKLQYTDEWCDGTVSAAAIKAGMVDLIGTEVGCEEHIKIFKQKGIWIEDGTIVPKPGYIILYNWGQSYQPNNGYADHIGVVEKVSNGVITCIEGNKNECVGYRSIPVGWGFIRGYAAPKYDSEVSAPQKPSAPSTPPSAGSTLNSTPKWTGYTTAKDGLNVRTWAGSSNSTIKTYPSLKLGTEVEVCDSTKAKDGSVWYFVRIAKKVYGFVHSNYVSKTKPASNLKPITEVAKEVLAGKWGNGDDRKNRITAAGYNYSEVQKKVNELTKKPDEVYVVKKNDTLSSIAAKYGTTYQKLAAYNSISNPNKINIGQKIKIPR